jgi:ArsR family transcriptional regulator, arsenate/arsenite/antimonite-responsive transcriptional repressor
MNELAVVKALAALAQEARLRIFRALIVAGNEGLTPGALVEQLEVTANTLSFHLKELSNAGLLTQERQGRFLIYRAEFTAMNELLAYLTENCCGGKNCLSPVLTSSKPKLKKPATTKLTVKRKAK